MLDRSRVGQRGPARIFSWPQAAAPRPTYKCGQVGVEGWSGDAILEASYSPLDESIASQQSQSLEASPELC